MIKIAIQGEPGSFSHEAATRLAAEMREEARIVPFSLSAEAFGALSRSEVDAAVIPIENSLAGSVSEHFDLMLTHEVTIVRETLLRIRHNLIAISGASLNQIDRVFSHPVALAQCRRFLSEHPKMESFAFYDTAGSVKQLVELRDRHAGGHRQRRGGQAITARRFWSPASKTTRRTTPASSTCAAPPRRGPNPYANKLSLAFTVENRVGTLVAALSELAKEGTNLTKIESRPVHGRPWEYVFYVDCQLNSPEDGARAIKALRTPLLHGQGAGPLRGSRPLGLKLRSQLALRRSCGLIYLGMSRAGLRLS